MARSLRERFEEKVDRSGDCHEWLAGKKQHGYGMIGDENGRAGRMLLAHRVAYEFAYGPIPPGMVVMHSCDNPGCVNPEHLSAGMHADNSRDMAAKGRAPTQKLHPDDLAEIRRLYDETDMTQSEIAWAFQLNQTRVSQIVREAN